MATTPDCCYQDLAHFLDVVILGFTLAQQKVVPLLQAPEKILIGIATAVANYPKNRS